MDETEHRLLLTRCLLLFGGVIVLNRRKRLRRKRRWQVRPLNIRSLSTVTEFNYFQDMKEEDGELFFKYTRMSKELFDIILAKVEGKLRKRHDRAIWPEEKLAITLKYLAQGGSTASLAFSFARGLTTVLVIIKETCEALWEVLEEFVSPPNENEWKEISKGFQSRWNMPLCLGALDGKHINVRAPTRSGSAFFNYKKTFSIVLLAAADDRYVFTLVDVGAYGSQSDGGILSASRFGRKLLDKNLKDLEVPREGLLPGTEDLCPHYFVADEAFPLQENIMRPFPGKNLTREKRVFNYRLSRARRIIENAFGILAARWRIFHQTISLSPNAVESIVLAAIALHNFIMKNSDPERFQSYCPASYVDVELPDGSVREGGYRADLIGSRLLHHSRFGSTNATKTAVQMRNMLADYFISPSGSVPWQDGLA